MVSAPPGRWWQVEFDVATAIAEDVAALSVAGGADGAELEAQSGDKTRLRLSFPGELTIEEVRTLTDDALAEIGISNHALDIRERVDTDWSERWKEHFEPLSFGERVWIVPSWRQGFSAPSNALTIEIDPGMAFGTGQHASTALCIEWAEKHLTARQQSSVLDVGCGSGILSMVCAKLGAGCTVGIDNDPAAVEVARANARDNNLELRFSDQPLSEVPGTFDVVIANIIAHTLCELAPELVRHTAPGGWLALSGILDKLEAEVAAAFAAACTDLGRPPFAATRIVSGHWVMLAAQL